MQRPETLSPYGENAIQVVSCLDEAIDWNKVDRIEYGKSRDWKALQAGIKSGAQPTIYHIRLLPMRTIGYLKSRSQEAAKVGFGEAAALDAFEVAVFRIDNFRRNDGAVIATLEPSTKSQLLGGKDKVPLFSSDEIEYIGYSVGYEVLEEIGKVAFSYNFLHPKTSIVYQLPHSLEQGTMTSP